ncbi:hypothetical protein [Bacillus sp. AFS031507]|nr:hypothetical protein [Bacillus sp. AFS031507]
METLNIVVFIMTMNSPNVHTGHYDFVIHIVSSYPRLYPSIAKLVVQIV